jgi:hypothetical protein
MPAPITIRLGGFTIALVPDQVKGEYDSIGRAVDFCLDSTPQINLQVHCGWFSDMVDQPTVFDTHLGWRYLKQDGKKIIRVRSSSQDPHIIGVFAHDFQKGVIHIARSEENPENFVFPLSYPMGELYIMNLLGANSGILFHAAGVIDQGKGYLFVGHGDAGKTTTARLWQEMDAVQVVNDDKVIVRKEDGDFKLYGTPWHGEGGMALPDAAPLKKIFVIKQAKENYAVPIDRSEASVELLTRAFLPLWDADMMDGTLGFLDDLCSLVPCHELGFLPDSSAVDFVRNLS